MTTSNHDTILAKNLKPYSKSVRTSTLNAVQQNLFTWMLRFLLSQLSPDDKRTG